MPKLDYKEEKPWTRKPWLATITPSHGGSGSNRLLRVIERKELEMNETFLMHIENLVWAGHLAEYWTLKNYLEMFLEF